MLWRRCHCGTCGFIPEGKRVQRVQRVQRGRFLRWTGPSGRRVLRFDGPIGPRVVVSPMGPLRGPGSEGSKGSACLRQAGSKGGGIALRAMSINALRRPQPHRVS